MRRASRRASPEDALQVAVVTLLRLQRIEGLWWSAINPKPHKDRTTAAKCKTMGMKAGVPDLMFIYRDQGSAMGFGIPFGIELKAPVISGRRTSVLSEVQKGMHATMRAAGCQVWTCTSIATVLDVLVLMGVPVKVSVKARAAA